MDLLIDKKIIIKRHICMEPDCNAAFTKHWQLSDHHLSKHFKIRAYRCTYQDCNKGYTSSSHLRRHIVTAHGEGSGPPLKQIKCDDCEKWFSNKYSLQKHKKRCHSNDNLSFPCTECDKTFKKKVFLNYHMVSQHGTDPPYKCDKCSLSFIEYKIFMKHKTNHRAFQCDCGEEFDRWTELCEHKREKCKRLRKEHKCVVCNKTFSRIQYLEEHSLVHVEDSQLETFKCSYLDCHRSYKYKKNLLSHIKTFHKKIFHLIQCPYEECGLILKSNKNLKQHLKICHSGLPKERKPRKPRKDKGIPKKSFASTASGFEVSANENRKNIEACTEKNHSDSISQEVEIILENIISEIDKNNFIASGFEVSVNENRKHIEGCTEKNHSENIISQEVGLVLENLISEIDKNTSTASGLRVRPNDRRKITENEDCTEKEHLNNIIFQEVDMLENLK